jgi:hypothetical protein
MALSVSPVRFLLYFEQCDRLFGSLDYSICQTLFWQGFSTSSVFDLRLLQSARFWELYN